MRHSEKLLSLLAITALLVNAPQNSQVLSREAYSKFLRRPMISQLGEALFAVGHSTDLTSP